MSFKEPALLPFIKQIFLTLVILLVIFTVLAFYAELLGIGSENLWRLVFLVAGWIGGLLTSLGIKTTA